MKYPPRRGDEGLTGRRITSDISVHASDEFSALVVCSALGIYFHADATQIQSRRQQSPLSVSPIPGQPLDPRGGRDRLLNALHRLAI